MRFDGERFLCQTVAEDVFLVDQRSGDSWRIGGTGGRMWALLTAGSTPQQVADAVAGETNADPALVLADVEEFVDRLVEVGALLEGPGD